MRILLVEPDPKTAQAAELMLTTEKFNVYTTDSGEEGLELAKLYDYDIIVLELNLPDLHGLEVLRSLREAKVLTPVMIFTKDNQKESRLAAFESGADDYISKPFDKAELVARIHSIVRRSKGHSAAKINIGDNIIVNLTAKSCFVKDRSVHLTGKEYGMIELLALRKGTVITKDMFLNHLYGGMDEPELKIIDVFICKLRKKLSLANEGKHGIDTVWGRGYTVRSDDYTHDRRPEEIPVIQEFAPVNNHQPIYDNETKNNEVATLIAQLEEVRRVMGISAEATMEETMARLQAFKSQGEKMLEDEKVPSENASIVTAVALAGEFAETAKPAAPQFKDGLRLPIGDIFRIGSIIEVDTSEGKAANIHSGYEVEFKPVVGAIFEILSYYQGKGLNKQSLVGYLFEKADKSNEVKLGMYMSQAQGVLTQLVNRELASMFVQVLSGGGYGMPNAERLLGYSGQGSAPAPIVPEMR